MDKGNLLRRESPIMFVKKKDGNLRLCVDYRQLNYVTKKDRYPLLLIGEALDRLQTAKYYIKLNVKDAYHSVRIKEGEEWKTTFTTKYSTYKYLVMPFGLTNAPAAFQRWINRTLQSYIDICCIMYLDDVLIYSDNLEQRQKDVAAIIRAIRQQGMKLKPSKCKFHQRETEYLGFSINNEGVKVDPIKTAAIWDWKAPTNKKGIQEFMGFCNFYRRFIDGFSRTAKLLYDRTKKDVTWEWGDKEQFAFDELRQKLYSTPVLTYFIAGRQLLVEKDASKYVCWGILSQQEEDWKWKPIAYRAKTMKLAECNYDVHDNELLAIVQALKEWRRYLKGSGQHFWVLTDHKNLIRFTTTKELTERQIRWSEVLSGFDFKIDYRPGKEGGKPDALTRRKADMPQEGDERLTQKERILLPKEKYLDTSIQEMEIMGFEWDKDKEVSNESARDNEIQEIRKALDKGEKEMKGVPLGLCQWKDGYLWNQEKILVPNNEGIGTNLIRRHHNILQAGHGGTAKTTELLQKKYNWPHMRDKIKQYVKNCDTCQRTNVVRHAPYGLMKPNEAPDQPWKSISMDFITDLPKSEENNAILMVIDRLTKMAHFIPCTKVINARQFSELFIREIFRLHGLPKDIITDQGLVFTSELWKKTRKQVGLERRLRTAFHAQTDGQMEWTNSTLEQYLRAYVNYQQDNWKELLPMAEFAYNNGHQESIKHTPFFANYQVNPEYQTIGHLMQGKITPPEDMSQLHDILRAEMTEAQLSVTIPTVR